MSELLLDHAENPRRFNPTFDPTGTGTQVLTVCSDEITVKIKLAGPHGKMFIEDVGFTGHGCVLCMAATSLLCEHVVGMRVENAFAIKPHHVCALLETDIPGPRHRCVEVPRLALRKALRGKP